MKARRRRSKDLDAYRKAERDRQRRHRAEKRGSPGPVPAGAMSRAGQSAEPMSRATLDAQVTAVIEECLGNLDRAFRLSRATLERELVRRLSQSRANAAAADAESGQAGP